MITFLPVVRLKSTGEKHRLFQKMKYKQHPWFSAFDSILFLLPDAVWNEHLEQQSLQASYNCWGSNYVESVLANLLSHTMLGWIATKTDLARVVQSVGSPGHPHFCCRCWLFTGTCLNQRFLGFKKDRMDFYGSPVIKNWLWNAGDSGLIPGWVTNINNFRYANDTTLMAEGEEELKILLMKVKESEKVGLKLNIQKTKIMASRPITLWEVDGETVETVSDFILRGLQNHCISWLQPWN